MESKQFSLGVLPQRLKNYKPHPKPHYELYGWTEGPDIVVITVLCTSELKPLHTVALAVLITMMKEVEREESGLMLKRPFFIGCSSSYKCYVEDVNPNYT